jgi:pantetheine-phosphate adenylyltransferase
MTKVLYPGSFDPVTLGHLDTAQRAARIFDEVVMAVFDQPKKQLLFSTEERVALLREATRDLPRISVATYSTLTVHFAREIGAQAIVRGMRSAGDFEHEFLIAQVQQSISAEIDVVVLMASHRYSFVSSSMVRELAGLGEDVTAMVPAHVAEALRAKFQRTR